MSNNRTTQKMNRKGANGRGSGNRNTGSSRIRTAPVAKAKRNTTRGPSMQGLPRGAVRIRHREYFTDISGSVDYAVKTYEINPGLGKVFPWLSKVASRYESYKFEKLNFSFETEAPTSSKGVVVLAIDYDPTDAAPLNKTAALSYEGASRSAPWDGSSFHAKKTDLSKRKSYFVRCGSLSADQTLGLTDVGNLFVATKAQADTSTIGEMYVEYDIILSTPQTDASSLSKRIQGSAGISNTAVFGSVTSLIGCLDLTASASTIRLNQETQTLLVVTCTGTGVTTPTTSSSTATVTNLYAIVNAAATAGAYIYTIAAQPEETVVFDFSGSTTITDAIARAGEYQVSLG